MDITAISEDNIQADNAVKSQAPGARLVTIAAMSEVTPNANSGADSMRQCSLSDRIDFECKIAKSDSCTYSCDAVV